MTTTSSFNENTTNGQDNGFICGVVEGFYGRPWTTEQRKELFRKWAFFVFICVPPLIGMEFIPLALMFIWIRFFILFHRLKRLGCNSYVYAPKDDVKHRLKWREMYTVVTFLFYSKQSPPNTKFKLICLCVLFDRWRSLNTYPVW